MVQIPRSLSALIGCDSDGDSEPIFLDSTLLRFDSIVCFWLRNFWRFQARESGNCASRDSPFCASKVQGKGLHCRVFRRNPRRLQRSLLKPLRVLTVSSRVSRSVLPGDVLRIQRATSKVKSRVLAKGPVQRSGMWNFVDPPSRRVFFWKDKSTTSVIQGGCTNPFWGNF